MKRLAHPYQLLPSSSNVESTSRHRDFSTHRQKHGWCWFLIILSFGISLAVNVFALVLWLKCHKKVCSAYPQLTNTPAKSVLSYKTEAFTQTVSIYEQDPSSAVDTAWKELYEFSNSTLPGQEEVPSFHEALKFVKEGGNRIRMLDVFHQLHCLDTIRQALYPHHYQHLADSDHIIHCVNSIRQSLVCMADVSLVSWEWDKDLNVLIESPGNLHTCRDFDRIRQWAMTSHFDRQFTPSATLDLV